MQESKERIYEKMVYLDRPSSSRKKMDVAHRAKQFAPFAALRGFEGAVRKQEIIYEPRMVLSDEKKEELDRRLKLVEKGMWLKVQYFAESNEFSGKGHHIEAEGMVEFFDPQIYLRIGDTEIPVSDITGLVGSVFDAWEQPC